ncbi:FtsX-like permease family protein [Saccharothrix sp. 6-C]|uniref:FtsX-like permease family protein n=1 Tax=Saccharothrix texasensis TaxID=103734 RepID=A0A3N1HAX8_9PSEU|nr:MULTISPECIES: FtsX-like permease family protein [Saccharothrix]QQQ76138.1 FtsX-like permease family protein [Saccharothrix sp. 6-C]ROP39669.1 FtsX-like permease family protein [Saccharothrix texasensis]
MRLWFADLALGVRLALGGGRTSWVRLALTGAGIGLGVAVLLAASSVTTVLTERAERQSAAGPVVDENASRGQASGDVLHMTFWNTDYRGVAITGNFVRGTGPGAPVPPGVSRVPGDGEIFVSPALAELLAGPDGELLRARFPQQVVGTIAQGGLIAPHDLKFYAGDASVGHDGENAIIGFGGEVTDRELEPVLILLIMVGSVALLFPVLVFVGITTRLAGAERDRRLAALRLVGAGSQRVRRIAAGEALLGAFVGLAVGAALFSTARQFVEEIQLLGISVFVDDLTPWPPLAVLIAVLVPVMAVLTSVIAMRRTVVEPLGVVRRTKPVRRVLWWRVVPIALGVAALLTQAGAFGGEVVQGSDVLVIGGVILLLLGIPVLLPWVVERAVGRLRGGAPSWQLAIRRLQLESGTAARVVGGVAVVLAGGIALQSVLASTQTRIVDRPTPEADKGRIVVSLQDSPPDATDRTADLLARSAGVQRALPMRTVTFQTGPNEFHMATVGSCEALRTQAALPGCRDGDTFYVDPGSSRGSDRPKLEPGQEVSVLLYSDSGEQEGPKWTVPAFTEVARPDDTSMYRYGLLVTPAAARDLPVDPDNASVLVQVDPDRPDIAEHVRNALAPMTWRAYTSYFGEVDVTERVKEFESIRQALLAGSLVTLLLAGASLLVLALEQVRERRRPLAVLAASGVPRGALSRSLLWQNAVPLLLALVVAVGVGGGLAVLLLRIISAPIVLDWAGIGLLSGASALLVVIVTLLSLPSLRRATGALGLRSE